VGKQRGGGLGIRLEHLWLDVVSSLFTIIDLADACLSCVGMGMWVQVVVSHLFVCSTCLPAAVDITRPFFVLYSMVPAAAAVAYTMQCVRY
jgi:hypothetical protein